MSVGRMRDMSLKLRIELVPKTVWFSSLYKLLPRELWDSIRTEHIRTAGAKCEICGSPERPLFLHEVWKYDDEKHVQKLLRFQLLCRKCHWIKHIGLAKIKADRGELDYDELVKHFCKVNQCPKKQKPIYHGKLEDFDGEIRSGMLPLITEVDGVEYLTIAGTKKDLDFDQHVADAFEVWGERSKHKWTQDFGKYEKYIDKKRMKEIVKMHHETIKRERQTKPKLT